MWVLVIVRLVQHRGLVLLLVLLRLILGQAVGATAPVERPSGLRPTRPSVAACSRDSRRPGAGCAPYDTSCAVAVG